MKTVRIFAVIVFLLGLFYSIAGVYMFLYFENVAQLMDSAKNAGVLELQQIDVSTWRTQVKTTSIVLAFIGILILVVSIGLFKVREWARKFWLGITLLLVLFHGSWLLSDYYKGKMAIEDGIEVVGVSLIAIISWVSLRRVSIRKLFHRDDVN